MAIIIIIHKERYAAPADWARLVAYRLVLTAAIQLITRELHLILRCS